VVPKFVHFIYGLDSQGGGPEFGFIQWLSIVSSYVSIRPSRIFFWYRGEPNGEWWERARPFVTDFKVARDVTEIHGNPVNNYAHKADILRLEILIEHGGIYLDTDFVVWRSFDSLLRDDCTMAHEGEAGWVGLGNSAIIAKPRAKFLIRWLEAYADFNDSEWNRHSILLPRQLAANNPSEIRVHGFATFFWPLWNEQGLQRMYTEKVHEFGKAGLANHLWESRALRFVLADAINLDTVEQVDLPIFCGMRRFFNVIAPARDAKDLSGAFDWRRIGKVSLPPEDRACAIVDTPLEDSLGTFDESLAHSSIVLQAYRFAVAFYDFDLDQRHPLKLLDASQHRLNGWFLDPTARGHSRPSTFPKFAIFPAPFYTVRKFDGKRGTHAVLPTLRKEGQTFEAFTFSFWMRFDAAAARLTSKMVLIEAVGDCDLFKTGEKCPMLAVNLRQPLPEAGDRKLKLGRQTEESKWIIEANILERKYGDQNVVVKPARIDSWGSKPGLLPDVWYRIQVSASRTSQILHLQVWKRYNNTNIALVDLGSRHYYPWSIVPARMRNIWVGGPWYLHDSQKDREDYFSGYLDRLIIVSMQTEDAEMLVAGRSSAHVPTSFEIADPEGVGMSEAHGKGIQHLPALLPLVDKPKVLRRTESSSPGLLLDEMVMQIALEPLFFLICLFAPLALHLLLVSRKVRKIFVLVGLAFLGGLALGECFGWVSRERSRAPNPILRYVVFSALRQAKQPSSRFSNHRPTSKSSGACVGYEFLAVGDRA
jgi:hypothetical protein